MSELKVWSLICPACGRGLSGLPYDRIFFCPVCRLSLTTGQAGWNKYPLRVAAPQISGRPVDFYLPCWEMKVDIQTTSANEKQLAAAERLAGFASVWIMAFTASRSDYFGDIGLIYTDKRITPQPADELAPGRFIVGGTRRPEDAQRYAELFVTLLIDRRADVTGMEIKVQPKEVLLWAIPFREEKDKVVEMLLGSSLPSFSIDDLEEVKRVNGIKAV